MFCGSRFSYLTSGLGIESGAYSPHQIFTAAALGDCDHLKEPSYGKSRALLLSASVEFFSNPIARALSCEQQLCQQRNMEDEPRYGRLEPCRELDARHHTRRPLGHGDIRILKYNQC